MMHCVMDGLMGKEKNMMNTLFYKNLHQEEVKVRGLKKIQIISNDFKAKEGLCLLVKLKFKGLKMMVDGKLLMNLKKTWKYLKTF